MRVKLDQMLIQLYRMISQDYQDKTSQAKYTSRKTRATDLQVMVIKRIKHIYYFILIVDIGDRRVGNGYRVEVEARLKIDGLKLK